MTLHKLAPDRSEIGFADYKGEFTKSQAVIEANRCLYCADAPCINACPTHIDIPEFIRKIATDNIKGSARTIFEANILGMSCARVCPVEVLCVGDCVYNHMDMPPIQIGKLQRYATDQAFLHGWTFFKAGTTTTKSVAMVGAGPASLACAHELRKLGHGVVIYDKNTLPGGLNTTGVAPHKMKADRALTEVEWILSIGGIEVKQGITVGRDVSFEQLEKDHDAVFLGFGLGEDTALDVPGKELGGVHGAVAYIEQLKLGVVPVSGVKTALVIGGGNTALDAVRELKSLGVANVVLVYRGQQAGMSGYGHEWDAAKVEGVTAMWQSVPVACHGAGNHITHVECMRLDDNKKPIAGSAFKVDAQVVLLAIGQSKLSSLVAALPGITVSAGRVVTDDHGFTGRPKYFAGGDCRNGGKEVVNAAAEGKAAAHAIHAHITGARHG
jgi:dihydropyrimidine dehydrogenase (NAD+) subunit PreT